VTRARAVVGVVRVAISGITVAIPVAVAVTVSGRMFESIDARALAL
jgi:hypothetical protein